MVVGIWSTFCLQSFVWNCNIPTSFLPDSVPEVWLITQKYGYCNCNFQIFCSWFKTLSWWHVSLYRRVAILPSPLSLDKPECLPWSAHNTVQKAYMWIGTWNSKFLHYKAVYTAYSCIMQVYNTTYVQVHGVLVLVHTNTRLYQNPQFMKSKSHISK